MRPLRTAAQPEVATARYETAPGAQAQVDWGMLNVWIGAAKVKVHKLCRYYRAQTKGKVESGVKYVKRNALARRRFESLDGLNGWLTTWS